MAKSIVVSDNLLKMLAKAFLHIQPTKKGELQKGESYEIKTAYGSAGTASIVELYTTDLYDVKATACLLACGLPDIREDLKTKGTYYADEVQHAIIRFTRRNETTFQKLIAEEFRLAAITLTSQPTMF